MGELYMQERRTLQMKAKPAFSQDYCRSTTNQQQTNGKPTVNQCLTNGVTITGALLGYC